uniref:lipoyl(octanoyl) transferase LipB n=1 Tax=Actinomyces timonensis TaxID=1288391 RepID=UPI003F560DF9
MTAGAPALPMERLDVDLGERLVPYGEGSRLQDEVHAAVASGGRRSTIIVLEHEPVYTVGRRAHSWERPKGDVAGPDRVPVVDVDRGGKVTWHGPGQLTVYPIVRLAEPIDVIKYVRALEAAVMDVCADLGIPTTRVEGRSGVWAPGRPDDARGPFFRAERKICALGVRVARGVTKHGIGLNVSPDLDAFALDRIIPCGIEDAGVTSVAAEARKAAGRARGGRARLRRRRRPPGPSRPAAGGLSAEALAGESHRTSIPECRVGQ